jgi:hypothetical protein
VLADCGAAPDPANLQYPLLEAVASAPGAYLAAASSSSASSMPLPTEAASLPHLLVLNRAWGGSFSAQLRVHPAPAEANPQVCDTCHPFSLLPNWRPILDFVGSVGVVAGSVRDALPLAAHRGPPLCAQRRYAALLIVARVLVEPRVNPRLRCVQ